MRVELDAATVRVEPLDQHNQALLANVHPPDWVNPEPPASATTSS